jgi:hypothetical protein
MKNLMIITVAVVLAGLFGWAVYDSADLRHKTIGYSEHEIHNSELELQTAIAKSNRDLDERLLEADIRLVELWYGPAAASRYRLSHTYPPTTKQHQLQCERLDKQFRSDSAKPDKDPW